MSEFDYYVTKLCQKPVSNYSLLFLLFEILIIILLLI